MAGSRRIPNATLMDGVKIDNLPANTNTSKQDTLVSGTNIKTINGSSILGSGDLTIAGTGDMVLASVQTVTGAKTFAKDKLLVKGTSTGTTNLTTANTSATNYTATLPTKDGTVAMTADITGTNSGTNTGDQFTNETISTLIGRGSAAGAGPAQEITLGTGLSMSGTTLNSASGGDMYLASIQSVTGAKTFDKDKILMKGTSTGVTTISTANTSATNYTSTLPADNGTLALTKDVLALAGGTMVGNIAMGANNITITGSIGATGAGKVTKIWATDAEFTNLPTINGGTLAVALSLSSYLTLSGGTMTGKVVSAGRSEVAKTYTKGSSGSYTVALDCTVNNIHEVTGHTDGNAMTFTITGDTDSQCFIVSILQGSGTVSTIAGWFATVRWAGGSVPTLTATINKRCVYGFMRTGANTYDGFVIGENI